MRRFQSFGLLALFLAFAACDSPGDEAADVPPTILFVALEDEHNCPVEVELTVESVPLKAGVDALISWAGLTRDVHGHSLDPITGVDSAVVLVFQGLGREEVMEGLIKDTLKQSAVRLFALCEPEDAACRLSSFGLAGNPWFVNDYFLEDSGTWLVFLQGPGSPGGLSYLFLEPRDDAVAEQADLVDTGSAVSMDTGLAALAPLSIPAAEDVELSWAGLKHDGKGVEIDLYRIDKMTVARYDGQTLEELAAAFVDLEGLAAETWTLDVSGRTTAMLSEFMDPVVAQRFHSMRDDEVWLLGLWCTHCSNPMPKFVTVLESDG